MFQLAPIASFPSFPIFAYRLTKVNSIFQHFVLKCTNQPTLPHLRITEKRFTGENDANNYGCNGGRGGEKKRFLTPLGHGGKKPK